MTATKAKLRKLTRAEAEERGLDAYGLLDETMLSLRWPREVDTTDPTLSGALKEAVRMMLEEGSESVTITTVSHYEDEDGWISVYENGEASVELKAIGSLDDLREHVEGTEDD